MAYGLIQNTTLQSIADAIRQKNESSDTYKPGEMAAAILGITTGEPDWTELGYEDAPDSVLNAFNYAKNIKDNWTVGSHSNQFKDDKKLYFFPSGLDLMGTNSYGDMFRSSNLMYIPPITLGFTSGSYGNTSLAGMFRSTYIEEITILGVKNTEGTDDSHYYNDCFNGCKNLKVANINSNPKLGVPSMFYDCPSLTTVTGLNTTGCTSFNDMFYGCSSLVNLPLLDTSSATNVKEMFKGCSSLVTAPNLDLSNITSTGGQSIFNGCTALENVPIYNVPKVTNMNMIFGGCPNLTDTSRDNILQMCVGATAYTGAKTLQALGFSNSSYSAASWQALPHYQDFIDAGWTIGYS